jgi:hypothetical protein
MNSIESIHAQGVENLSTSPNVPLRVKREQREQANRGSMKRFEYNITKYPSDEFKQLIYFCTDQGKCNLEEVPSDQLNTLGSILDERGEEGWELIQVFFGRNGVVAFWKRDISNN